MKINRKFPHRQLILSPDLNNFVKSRKIFGNQTKAATVLEFSNQTVVSHIETERNNLTPLVYSLMLLLAGTHDYYELKAKSNTRSLHNFIINPFEYLEAPYQYLIEVRNTSGLDTYAIANLMGCSESAIKYYEKPDSSQSNRFFSALMLMFDAHPYFYLKKRVSR